MMTQPPKTIRPAAASSKAVAIGMPYRIFTTLALPQAGQIRGFLNAVYRWWSFTSSPTLYLRLAQPYHDPKSSCRTLKTF